MKPMLLVIEWRHLNKAGQTCDRCADTGQSVRSAVESLVDALEPGGWKVALKETLLTEEEICESNAILLNGVPLEQLLPNTRKSENCCASCGELLGSPTMCRTLERDGQTFEAIPATLIVEAAHQLLHDKEENMSGNCCPSNGNIMILACSGGSNVGQLSNQAAVELTWEGYGKMFCLAGIGGQLSGFVQSARDAPVMVAIDGCPIGCAKAVLEQAQVPLKNYLVLTDEGFEKNKNLKLDREDIDRVKAAVKRTVRANEPRVAGGQRVAGCGCASC